MIKNSMVKNAPEGKHFYFNNGKSAKNLNELYREMKKMNDSRYSAFVNSTKNDFYNWINEVLCCKKLASSIKKVKRKDLMMKKIQTAMKDTGK